MLEVEGIHTYYGLSHVLYDVSLTVKHGRVVCLLGRNGAGKTTTLKSIMGLTPPKRGIIRYKDEAITGSAPYRIARKGIGYVPDDRRIFADLTVSENLDIARRSRPDINGTRNGSSRCFPSSRRSPAEKAESFPAASRKCWPLPGP